MIDSTPDPKPAMLTRPGAQLFRPGHIDLVEDALPFVIAEPGNYQHWVVPRQGGGDDEHDAASALGARHAAAAFLVLSNTHPGEGLLWDIAKDMMKAEGKQAAVISFWSYIERLLWLYGQHLSTAQVAADVEAVILENRQNATDVNKLIQALETIQGGGQ